nr:protein CROWDED NUCLEI 3-like [Ciona intestinalis]|eukprot:XP_009860717.1 protein CROWDED NUCLEI 3-like [Ciona intestinalis]
MSKQHGKSGVKSEAIVVIRKGKPQLKLDRLETILHNYQDHPVAIISVFGEHRTGKSFLLNFLCQYLRENQSADWYKKNYVKLVNTFHWKGGVERDTTGIYMTDKPFMLKNDKGQDIAVFLMDTQGSFQKKFKTGECSLMFGLSTLLSSVHVYNLSSGLIRDNDFQHLEVFNKYAQALTERNGEGNAPIPSPFQGLMFLVRNWEMSDYEPGSKGGMEYLTEVIKAEEDGNDSVRKQIMKSFSDVRCHLLPHPGVKVTKYKDSSRSSIKLADLDESFLVGVDDLGNCLFSKKNLLVKQLNGGTCTGKEIMKLALEFKERIKSSDTPNVHTLLKINETVGFCQKLQDFEAEYEKNMITKMGENYMEPKMLLSLHEECQEETLSKYAEHEGLTEEKSLANKNYMRQCLSVAFKAMQHKNNARKENEKILIVGKAALAVENVYLDEMEKVASGQYLEDLTTAREKAVKATEELFQASTLDCNQDLVKKCTKDLHNAVKSKHREFKRKNAERLETLDQKLSMLVVETAMSYEALMEKEIKKTKSEADLDRAHQNAHKASVKKFEENDLVKGLGLKCKKDKVQSLSDKITECFQTLKKGTETPKSENEEQPEQDNKMNYVQQQKEAQALFEKRKELALNYSTAYNDHKEKYVEDGELYKIHIKAKQQALKAFSDFGKDISSVAIENYWENKDALEQELEQLFDQVKENNVKNKKNIERSLNPFYEELSADYLRTMNKASRNASDATLGTLHEVLVSSINEELNVEIPYENIQQIAIATCEGMLREQQDEVNNGRNIWKELMDQAGASTVGLSVAKTGSKDGRDSVAIESILANFNVNISQLASIQFLKSIKF